MGLLEFIVNRKVNTKLIMLSLAYLVPIGSLTYHVISNIQVLNIDFAAAEKAGTAYTRPLRDLIQAVGQLRVQKENVSAEQAGNVSDSANAALKKLNAAQAEYGELLLIKDEKVKSLSSLWSEIDNKLSEPSGIDDKSLAAVLLAAKALWDTVGGTSKLILDPDLDTYNLMDVLVAKLPASQLRLTELAPYLAAANQDKELSNEEKTKLAIFASHLADTDMAFVKGESETALAEDEGSFGKSDVFQSTYPPALTKYLELSGRLVEMLNAASGEDSKELDAAEINKLINSLWMQTFVLWDSGINSLDSMLDARIDFFESARVSDITPSYLILALTLLLVWIIQRSITKPLNSVLTDLRNCSGQVASASQELAASSQALAQGATQQAASLEETSASLEQVASMSKQSSSNASQATQITKRVEEYSRKGVDSMRAVAQATNDIKVSADETAEIVRIIDSIAFQTNLLALNAAVEAARAGDAGKGFAVVAEEVRNLARRSAEAAQKTSEKIGRSKELAENGVKLVADVSSFLEGIYQSALQAASIVGEISAATSEQTTSIQQISQAMAELDKVTQINSASAEESSASGEELLSQATAMNGMVDQLSLVVHGPSGLEEDEETQHFKGSQATEVKSSESWTH